MMTKTTPICGIVSMELMEPNFKSSQMELIMILLRLEFHIKKLIQLLMQLHERIFGSFPYKNCGKRSILSSHKRVWFFIIMTWY